MAPHASKAAARAEARKGITTDFRDLNLHGASANGNIGLVKYALEHGQPVNSVLNGVQPLHAAASSGNEAVVRMLIEHGADVNAPRLPRRYTSEKTRSSIAVGTSGSTALHFAAANGHTEVIRVLLAFGASPTAKEKYGLTPQALALQNGHEEAAAVLHDSVNEGVATIDPAASRTSLRSLGKKRLHPQRSLDTIALKVSQQASNPHLPSLNLTHSTSSAGNPSPLSPSRRGSISSSMTDDTRRSVLPAVLEKATAPAASLKQAISGLTATKKRDEAAVREEEDRLDLGTSFSSTSSVLTRNNSTSSYHSRAAHAYRPRLSSNLSGRAKSSDGNDLESSPRITIDDAPLTRPTSNESTNDTAARASSALFRQHVRDRSNSNASSGSSYSKRATISPFARAHPAVQTRGSRSNSVGTDARSSSSPSSSYSGFGTYAPSTATTAATSPSLAQSTAAYSSIHAPLNALSPLYESSPAKKSDTPSSTITTSEQARSQAKKMEREILSVTSASSKSQASTAPTTQEGQRSVLAQKLAAYGQTLSLEKKLKAMELGGGSGPSYRWETISKDGKHQETPVTAGQLKPPVEILGLPSSSAKMSSSPKQSKSPGRRSSVEELAPGVPQWRAIPSGDRLVPPSSSLLNKRSVSPVTASSSSSAAMARNRLSKDKSGSTSVTDRPASPASTSGSSSIIAGPSGTTGISYEVISPSAGSSSAVAKSASKHASTSHTKTSSESKGKSRGSDKAHSNKGSSVTSAKDQVAIDAAEQARIDATIPHAIPIGAQSPSHAAHQKKKSVSQRIFGSQ